MSIIVMAIRKPAPMRHSPLSMEVAQELSPYAEWIDQKYTVNAVKENLGRTCQPFDLKTQEILIYN